MSSNDIIALQSKAESGDAEAMLKLALALNEKEDSEPETIFKWVEKAANLGNAEAQFELADIFKKGMNNDSESFKWMKKSAENGNINAKYNLATYYLEGCGTPRDNSQAFYWAEKASNDGYMKAKTKLGSFYIQGIGVSINEEKGLTLLHETAAAGDEIAKDILKSYNNGNSGKKSKLIVMIVGLVIFGGIGILLSSGGNWYIGLLVGAYFGIGMGPIGANFKNGFEGFGAATWGAAKQRYHEAGFSQAVFQFFVGAIFGFFWELVKVFIKSLISPFVAIHQLVTDK